MSADRVTAPYGTWRSPISAADVARAERRLAFPTVAGDEVWWQETCPEEDGRTTIVQRTPDGATHQLLPAPWSARTRVHEYGGRSYLRVPSGGGHAIVFANYADQRLYRRDPADSKGPWPLTPQPAQQAGLRYADFVCSPDETEVWCVRESHSDGTVTRAIVAVPLDGGGANDPDAVRQLAAGSDFLAYPRPSPDGRHLAWIAWNHPRMPWDGTELRVARIADDGTVERPHTLTGGATESVLSPSWSGGDAVYAVSDWAGWWNLYRLPLDGSAAQAVYPSEEEFGSPPWVLGGKSYAVLDEERLAVLHGVGGLSRLGVLDDSVAELTDFDLPYTVWSHSLHADGDTVVGVAASSTHPRGVVRVDVRTGEAEVLARELGDPPDESYLPTPRSEVVTGPLGRQVHAHVYPPANPDADAPAEEKPPYVAFVHGGPTGNSPPVLDLEVAYFTSRGIGVVDVDYGGSSGYGRAYRERLRGQWGIVDVDDTVAAVRALVERGEADGERLAIRGGSSGGWTALAALTRTDVFKAGTSFYGVAELLRFAEETHDFESRYLDGLVGELPANRDVYVDRAPLSHVDEISCPVLLLQGLDDPIVLPSQAEMFAKALANNGIPHAYVTFEGEAHGFRKVPNVIASLEAELSFYGQVLGFEPPGVPQLELNRPAPPNEANDAGEKAERGEGTDSGEA